MKILLKIINDLFTGKDNQTFDIGRIMLFLAEVIFWYLAICKIHYTHDFNPVEFGTGQAAILTGFGALLAFKAPTEPKPKGE